MRCILLNKIIIIFILLLFIIYAHGQNFTINHRKYWYYKSRLNNDFVKVGIGPGESLVFNERGVYGENSVSTSFSSPADGLQIGDGTSTLGYYIAMLALEYQLLSSNNQKTDSTLYELSCALYAINRLDYKAEATLNNSNCIGNLNGFFVRDDVPCDFIQNNYDHFNYFSKGINNNSQSRGFASYFASGMSRASSSWCDDYEIHGNNYTGGLFYISQDQVYSLLYGLAFVRKFVPSSQQAKDRNGNTFWFQDGQTSINEEAKAIAKRIVDNIRNPKKCDGSGCPGLDWMIKRPDNCNQSSLVGNNPYSYPLAESECVLDHYSFGDHNLWSVVAPSLCKSPYNITAQYHTWYSLTVGYTTWWGLTILASPLGIQIVDNTMPANIAAVCNCIYLQPLPGIISPTFFGGLYYMNRTAERIDKIASVGNYYWYLFHAPLGRYILHGGDLIINNDGGNIYPQRNNPLFLLNEMNPCDHFNLGGTSNYSSLGWSTDTRLDHPERIGNNTWTGEYPAIDYMLYFNLWSMKTAYDGGISIPKYINLSHYYINSSTVPYWSGGYYNPTPIPLTASNSYKTQVDAYETVYMEKTKLPFYTNTNYIRAGKEIILKATSTMGDGGETYIKAGAVTWGVSDGTTSSISDAGIRFYIKKYDCAIENGNYDPTIDVSYSYKTISQGIPFNYGNNIAQNEDSTYNGTLRFSIKPHYIEYQKENIIGNIQSENTYHEAGAQDNTNSEFIQIIPNPADDEIAIIIPNDFRYDRIEITNIAGDCLEKIIQNSEQKIKLNISNYAAGIYFISLYSKEWLIYSQKLIKR